MAIESYFFNAVLDGGTYDRIYNADDVTSYLDKIVGNGVFADPSTNLQVRASTGMNVIVGAGQGWIDGHKMINTADLTLELSASDVLLGRIDRVVFYVDYSARNMGIDVLEGTPASSPVAPALTQSASRWELCLAEISVAKQVTAITNAMITDTRGNASLCGYVAGLIDQIDATTLFQQWQTEFDDWFDEVKDDLVTATLIRKYEANYTTQTSNESTFNVKTLIPEYAYGLDILEIRINGLSLASNEFTKNGNSVTLAVPVTHVGTPISFVIYKSVDGSDAESVVSAVTTLQGQMDVIQTGIYSATGVNDNQALSTLVKNFLSGADDYQQLELDVYGTLGITVPATELTEANIAYWFDFSVHNATRRVKLNFAHCSRIIIDCNDSDEQTDVLINCDRIEIANLQAVMNNMAGGQIIVGEGTLEDCAFWINGLSGQTGTITGAEQGTFTRCRMSITASSGKAYGFSANGNVLRLNDCEVIAYNASGASNESVAVQVQANETENVLIMNGCSCPLRSRSGYKQDNVVKINSGFYALANNMLGKASVKYNTGDGKTETGTMIVSK